MHSEYKNDHIYLLACLYRYCTSQLSEIRKQKQNTSVLETLIGLRKLHIYLTGVFT